MKQQNLVQSSSRTATPPTHEQISRLAHELWEKRGQPAGRDDDIWLEAEKQLHEAYESSNGRTGSGAAAVPESSLAKSSSASPSSGSSSSRNGGGSPVHASPNLGEAARAGSGMSGGTSGTGSMKTGNGTQPARR